MVKRTTRVLAGNVEGAGGIEWCWVAAEFTVTQVYAHAWTAFDQHSAMTGQTRWFNAIECINTCTNTCKNIFHVTNTKHVHWAVAANMRHGWTDNVVEFVFRLTKVTTN